MPLPSNSKLRLAARASPRGHSPPRRGGTTERRRTCNYNTFNQFSTARSRSTALPCAARALCSPACTALCHAVHGGLCSTRTHWPLIAAHAVEDRACAVQVHLHAPMSICSHCTLVSRWRPRADFEVPSGPALCVPPGAPMRAAGCGSPIETAECSAFGAAVSASGRSAGARARATRSARAAQPTARTWREARRLAPPPVRATARDMAFQMPGGSQAPPEVAMWGSASGVAPARSAPPAVELPGRAGPKSHTKYPVRAAWRSAGAPRRGARECRSQSADL